MVRITSKQTLVEDIDYVEIACLSTDDKPTSSRFATGSVCIEVDTGDAYLYDEVDAEWNKLGGGES